MRAEMILCWNWRYAQLDICGCWWKSVLPNIEAARKKTSLSSIYCFSFGVQHKKGGLTVVLYFFRRRCFFSQAADLFNQHQSSSSCFFQRCHEAQNSLYMRRWCDAECCRYSMTTTSVCRRFLSSHCRGNIEATLSDTPQNSPLIPVYPG